jgi:cell division topological specificity factor
MGLLDYFRASRRNSAAVAKDRLQILIAHERAERNSPSYLPMLQNELLAVVRKYVHVDHDAISVSLEQSDNQEILELNIVLPEDGQVEHAQQR